MKKNIESLVDEELNYEVDEFVYNNSAYEEYAVLLEETEELEDEVRRLRKLDSVRCCGNLEMVWASVKRNDLYTAVDSTIQSRKSPC